MGFLELPLNKLNTMETAYLIVPGLGNSGEKHWQSLWEKKFDNFYRVQQSQWENPYCCDWIHTIEKHVEKLQDKQLFIVAHSLGCIAVAHWAQQTKLNVNGVFLVAPPDIAIIQKYDLAKGFTSVPHSKLPFESVLIASTNDSFAKIEVAQQYASYWESTFVNVGAKGHINAESGFGEWPQGLAILNQFVEANQLIPQN